MGEETPRRGRGRPVGSSKNSDQEVALLDTNVDSYKNIKGMLEFLPDAVRDSIMQNPMSRKQLHRINISIAKIKSGTWSVFPMICAGDRCPYSIRCPLHVEGLAPVTLDCPIEQDIVCTRMGAYMDALNINPENIIEVDQIGTVVMCDMMIMRVRNWMSRRPDGHVDVNATGIDNHGNVVLSRGIATEILIEEKYTKMKGRVLESLLATREVKAKYDVIDESDPGVKAAILRERAQDIRERKALEAETVSGKLEAKAQFLENIAKLDINVGSSQ